LALVERQAGLLVVDPGRKHGRHLLEEGALVARGLEAEALVLVAHELRGLAEALGARGPALELRRRERVEPLLQVVDGDRAAAAVCAGRIAGRVLGARERTGVEDGTEQSEGGEEERADAGHGVLTTSTERRGCLLGGSGKQAAQQAREQRRLGP